MASAVCPQVRGVCIAGKPGSYSLRGLCWSRLACDGFGGVSVSSRRLHRGQARFLQLARALLEQACLRWRRWGVSAFAVAASRASPVPTACAGFVGAGLPAMASAGCQWVRGGCIAGKPGSYSLRGLCWSWLACDGVGGVSVRSRCLHRGQAQFLQLARALLGQACLRWLRRGVSGFAVAASRASPVPLQLARALLELACLRWLRRGVSGFAVSASRASPAPTALRGVCWSRLACDGVGGVPVGSRRLYRGQARLLQLARALLQACLPWRRRYRDQKASL